MGNTGRKIIIDPITRVEGHGRVTLHLDEDGKLGQARFHIVEFRGFERFIQGHPYWEVPALVQRLCGICPVSHHLAAAKAVDRLEGLEPENLTPAADLQRRLLHYGQIFQSHALHFFYLAAPDLLFGTDAPAAQRNVVSLANHDKELARKGILMRKFGQEIIRTIAGKRIHGVAAVPGGVYKVFTPQDRDFFLDGQDIPHIDTMIEWSLQTLDLIKKYHETHRPWLDTFASYPSGHLGTVNNDGGMELYHGRLRAIDEYGNLTLKDVPDDHYRRYFSEGVERWTYLKFPYLTHLGREKGWNRVGPLSRVNVCTFIPTPLAEKARQTFKAITDGHPNHHTMYYHYARIIELLHCAEVIKNILHDDRLLSPDIVVSGERRSEGIGVVEAPRGTLIHHYEANDKGKITRCNLIVSTTHNNEAMNKAVREVARHTIDCQPEITEGMLNGIEVAIRAFDPCLSCATHAIGQMPLQVQLFDAGGTLLHEKTRD
jgi:NAD-reducing hydrogenase large subunit